MTHFSFSPQKVMLLDLDAPLTEEDLQQVVELLQSGQPVAIVRATKSGFKTEESSDGA